MSTPRATIAVHGGSDERPAADEPDKQHALAAALALGEAVLARGGEAIDAVFEAVRALERSGKFLAGDGADPQADGVRRLDASVMASDGTRGAVIGVSAVRSPITAAHAVATRLTHACLVGAPADEVLAALALEPCDPTPRTRSIAECLGLHAIDRGKMFGTVGAVAVDTHGNLAAATSTGGHLRAVPGRAGDSGVLGAATLATARCAVSCTGDGDRMLPQALATRLDAYLELGLEFIAAIRKLRARLQDTAAQGGFIALAPDGRVYRVSHVLHVRACASAAFEEV